MTSIQYTVGQEQPRALHSRDKNGVMDDLLLAEISVLIGGATELSVIKAIKLDQQ